MRYLLLLLLLISAPTLITATSPCGAYYDSTTTYCINCTTGILLMDSTQIICSTYAQYTNQSTYCNPTQALSVYGSTDTTGSTYFGTEILSDSIVIRNSLVKVCYDCEDYISVNCTTCFDNSTFLSSVELRTLLYYTLGCNVCAEKHTMSLIWQTELQVYVRTCVYTGDYLKSCTITQYYDTTALACTDCNSKFPNCAACNSSSCIICNENFYYSTMIDYDGNSYGMCVNQMCKLNYGPDMQNKTTCKACTISNCRSCIYQNNGTQICQFCNKGYYMTDSTTCTKQASTITQYFYVQASSYAASSVSSTTLLASTGSWAKPFYFLHQALIQAERTTFAYKQVTTYIYMLKGTHFYFQCDSAYYDPSATDSTSTLFNYCATMGKTLSNYYFINDNNQVYIQALMCTDANNLGLSSYTSKCVASTDTNPTIYINSPRFYFNITNYYSFKNLIFSGANAFAYNASNTAVQLKYFPAAFCNVTSYPLERYGYMNFSKLEANTSVGFNYNCTDPFYSYSNVTNKTNITTKCTSSHTTPQGLQSCEGEPYFQSYFKAYTAVNTSYGDGVYYEQRRKTLFNLYGFNDFMSQINTPPTLVIANCEFKFFLYGYESLINVETYSMYINTQPTSWVSNSYQYYTFTGRDKGANIQITDSTFRFNRFCKGGIVYRKPPFIDDLNWIFNLTHQFSNVRASSQVDNKIVISSTNFTQMNHATNQTTFTKYSDYQAPPQLAIYSGVIEQASLYVDSFMHKGLILNTDQFGGPVEVYNCQVVNNSIFLPEILMVNTSVGQTYDLSYFENTVTNEYEFSACNYDNYKNQYFLSNAFNDSDSLNQLVLEMDRMSPFYISKNYGPIIFRGSNFSMNIGTFGGALHISSPNFAWAQNAYAIILNCTFSHNMAYFSGGAVYIRSTLSETTIDKQVCAGTHILNSTFKNNMGLKKGNGGAVTLYCDYMDKFSFSTNDLATSSGITRRVNATYYNQTEFLGKVSIVGYAYTGESFSIYSQSSSIQNTTFTQNYVGFKGSAVYVKYVSQLIIYNCSFAKNGPAYSTIESTVSPYYQLFSNQSIMYYDEKKKCKSELEFLQKCNIANITIQWPQVQGALAIEFCGETLCMSSTIPQALLIDLTTFVQNDAGPYLSSDQGNLLTSSLYISGGFNHNISNTMFINQSGLNASQMYTSSSTLYSYMPSLYYNYSHAPQIRMEIQPDQSAEALNFTTQFSNCTFYNNSNVQILGTDGVGTYYGSLINYISNVADNELILPKFIFQTSTVTDNYFLGDDTSLFYINNAQVTIQKNKFLNNGYMSSLTNTTSSSFLTGRIAYYEFSSYSFQYLQAYGIFWLDIDFTFNYVYYHQVYLNTFKFNFADQGCSMKMDILNQNFLMSRNTVQYNFAYTGGAHIAVFSSSGYNVVEMQNETIQYVYGGSYGAIYSDIQDNAVDNQLVFYMKDSSFSNCNSLYGQAISAQQVSKVYCQNIIFNKTTQTNETNYVVSQFVKVRRILSVIGNYTIITQLVTQNAVQGYIYLIGTFNVQSIEFGGYEIQSPTYSLLSYNEFYNCTFSYIAGQFGSAIYAESARIYIQSDDSNQNQGFQNMTGQIGILSLNLGSELIAKNVIFQNNRVSKDASVIFSDASKVFLYNCIIQNNSAPAGQGAIFSQGNSGLHIETSSFLFNYAYEASTLYANMNKKENMTITNSQFVNNTSTLSLMVLKQTTLVISNSKLIDNIAQSVTHGVTLSTSSLTLINSAIAYSNQDFINNNNYQADVGFFNLIYMSTLNLTSGTNIQNCRGKTAATIYAASKSILYLEKDVTIQNCKSSEGSNIFIALAKEVIISETTFTNNSLMDIYFERVNLSISDSRFYNGANNFIYGYYSNVTLISVEFENISNSLTYGGGIYCSCMYIQAHNCSFKNLVALYGGAMYLNLYIPNSYSNITQSLFFGNKAQFGGAIFIETVNILQLQANSFIQNQAIANYNPLFSASDNAQGIGGAIFYGCTTSVGVACTTTLLDQNSFIRNSATHQGGAIKYLQNIYTEVGTPSFFDSNYAVYGSDIASYPKFINYTFVTNNDDVTQDYSRRVLSDDSSDWNIVSGVGFNIQFQIYDQQNNPYKIENTSIAEFIATGDNSSAVQLSNNMATASLGHFSFTNLQVLSTPGVPISLQLQITGLTNYGNTISFIQTPIALSFKVRSCVLGESWTTQSACVLCPVSTYLLVVPSQQVNCSDCSPNAICYSGSNVAPRDGYWRSANTSENFIQCPNYYSCLAGNETMPNGQCATGYQGALCGDCIVNYTKSSVFHCTKCASSVMILVQIAVELILVILYTLFLTNNILANIEKEGPPLAIYLKIITSYLQVIGIISTINFGWPNQVQKFLTGLSGIVDFPTKILQFDCLLQYSNGGVPSVVNMFYFQLIILFFLPLILFIISILVWIAAALIKRNIIRVREKILCTFLILIFLNYPAVVTIMFQGTSCIKVDKDQRLMSDITVLCFSGKHLTFFLILVIPGLILWALGIPLVQLIFLYRNRVHIKKFNDRTVRTRDTYEKIITLKTKYGFLLLGLELKDYAWDIVIYARKGLLIAFAVSLQTRYAESQTVICTMVIILSLIIQIYRRPYNHINLNNLEIASIIACLVTIYCGMYYATGASLPFMTTTGVRTFFFIVILVVNLLFIALALYYIRIEVLKYLYPMKNELYFKILAFGLTKRETFIEKYYKKGFVSRERKYRIEDEDLEDEGLADGENNKIKNADIDQVVNPSDKKDKDTDKDQKYDDVISRMYHGDKAKMSMQTSKMLSVLNPKDILLDLKNNKSSDSLSMYSEEEEDVSLKKQLPSDRKSIRQKEAKIVPIDKVNNYLQYDTSSNSKNKFQIDQNDMSKQKPNVSDQSQAKNFNSTGNNNNSKDKIILNKNEKHETEDNLIKTSKQNNGDKSVKDLEEELKAEFDHDSEMSERGGKPESKDSADKEQDEMQAKIDKSTIKKNDEVNQSQMTQKRKRKDNTNNLSRYM